MIKASIPWTCKQVHKMVMNGSLIFDNAIQRGFVWDKNRQSLLIDSILRGFPIPPFYTIKDGRTVQTPKGQVAIFDAIDGKQRCTTIARFKNNQFALCDLEQTIITEDGTELDLNGLTYDELPDDLKDAFDSASLTVYYFTDATDEEITEMMSRLNNGKPLSATENTRIKAKDLAGIQRIANHMVFTENMSETALNGYQNEDVVIKTYAVLTQENKSLDNKAIRPLYENLEMTSDLENRLDTIFNTIAALHFYLVNNKKKKTAKKLITRTHMISIAPIIERAAKENRDAVDLAEFFNHFFDGSPSINSLYNVACTNGSNHASNVEIRLTALNQEYDRYFNNNIFADSQTEDDGSVKEPDDDMTDYDDAESESAYEDTTGNF